MSKITIIHVPFLTKVVYNVVGDKNMRNHIKRYREEEGLTQQEYADLFGIFRKTLYEIETGKADAKLDLAFKITAHYNAFIEEVFESKYRFSTISRFNFEELRRLAFDNWFQDMITNWKKKKVDKIVELFSEECEYYETPFEKLENKGAIITAWQDIAAHNIKSLTYTILGQQNNRCIARVLIEEKDDRIVDMIYSFELDHDKKCTKFTQWYNINEGEV